MAKEDVKETCTDPNTRNLRRVTLDDADEAFKAVYALMGPKVDLRRDHYSKETIHI